MTNKFFNNYTSLPEQKLIADLITEAISIYGHDVKYMPRSGVNVDEILNEYEFSQYNDFLETEVYVKNFNQFDGDGVLLEKFGLEVRDQLTLTISVNTFEKDIASNSELTRPMEGDLLWIPFLNTAYEIKFVETTSMFYQFGDIQTYDLVTELFEFSQEEFDTGDVIIDDHFEDRRNVLEDFLLLTEDGDTIQTPQGWNLVYDAYKVETADEIADNFELETSADEILDWSESTPFGEL